MFEIYHNENGSRGSMSEVWIDKNSNLVKKYYKLNGKTVKNRAPLHNTLAEITNLYQNEIFWVNKLKSKYLLETYEHGPLPDGDGYYILQEWGGPDLLQYRNEDLPTIFPNINDQLEEMFAFFKDNNVYKLNNAKCNLTGSNGKLRCFDFKYAAARNPTTRKTFGHIQQELRSISDWIGVIDPALIPRLQKYVLCR